MITLNFYLFLAICEVAVILLVVAVVQTRLMLKYRPYYMVNTQPELFLKKYIQYLIKVSRNYGHSLQEVAEQGDTSANKYRQNMAARINWLVLERDFAITTSFNERYWQDINKRIKNMLKRWEEVEFITAPPDINTINLAMDDPQIDDIDFENADIDQLAKNQILSLTKRVHALKQYESMFHDMEMAYNTLEASYNELNELLDSSKLNEDQIKILKGIVQRKENNEKSLNQMLQEVESSKSRLHDELKQLEDAYMALEQQITENKTESAKPSATGNSIDAQEMVQVLNQQEEVLNELRETLSKLNIDPEQREELDNHADSMEKNNNEINHCMQMIELERERLAEEVEHLQKVIDE